jgi:PAS domain S-box-containing protein
MYKSARDKFLGLSLESTRKSYYPQLKQQLETAKENERQLQLLIDNLPARISYIDKNEQYVFVNRRYEQAFKRDRREIIGKTIREIIGQANYAKVKKHVHDTLAGKMVRYEAAFVNADGDREWSEIANVPDIGKDGSVNGFYVLASDITDKKKAEEEKSKLELQLRQAQKFEAIGTLAGGIAHDFNNLLMGIQGRLSLIATELDSYDPHMEHIQAVEEYIKSAINLTRQLLGFARGGKYEVKTINICDLVENSATMFGRTRKDIRIHIKNEQPFIAVDADRGQLEQVLLNMYVNAWQAMPKGGDLYLHTGQTTLDPAFCRPHDIEPGRYAKITISDTGIGMDKTVSRQIFDPFFTTKEKGRGTGLGLASAYGIIKNHGGTISVSSELGRGTTFNIYLPASDKKIYQEASIDQKLIKGSETILLVDDEEMITDVGQAMLEKLGYHVLVSRGGQEAIQTVTDRAETIDLVILDLIMPGVDGEMVFDQIRQFDPQIPIMLSSGYAIDGQAQKIMDKGCNGFIQKPFDISKLSKKIRQILAASESNAQRILSHEK